MRLFAIVLASSISVVSFAETKAEMLEGHMFMDDCDEGIAAFETTVLPVLEETCVFCHTAAGPGPGFVLDTSRDTYFAVKNYVNFNDIPNSTLRIRAGIPHSCGPNCNPETGQAMEEAIQSWWGEGEDTCPTTGQFFTGSITVPDDLPREGQGFQKFRWPLDDVDEQFDGHYIELDAQQFVEATTEMPGAYRFRAPRIVGTDKTLHLQNIRVLVNRKFDILASNYTYIDARVGPQQIPGRTDALPYPVLSADRLIVLQDMEAGDEISVSFEVLEESTEITCDNVPSFVENVMPTLNARNCYGCHGGGPEDKLGFSPANESFYMNISSENLCRGFIQRLNASGPAPAPGIAYPLLGVNGHPKIFVSGQELFPYWNPWLETEL